jgi:hypothetical protein
MLPWLPVGCHYILPSVLRRRRALVRQEAGGLIAGIRKFGELNDRRCVCGAWREQ